VLVVLQQESGTFCCIADDVIDVVVAADRQSLALHHENRVTQIKSLMINVKEEM
jgi:hypothetical protein